MHAVLLSLRADVAVVSIADRTEVRWASGGLALGELPSAVHEALAALASEPRSEDSLVELVRSRHGSDGLPLLYHALALCAERGLLAYLLQADGVRIVSARSIAGRLGHLRDPAPGVRFRLSRFAYCRRREDDFILEAAISGVRVTLMDTRAGAAVAELARGCTVEELVAGSRLSHEVARPLVALLADAGIVDEVDGAGRLPEDGDDTLRHWDFHDLVFHARSRLGGTDEPFGATFRLAADAPPLPAVEPLRSQRVLDLPRPAMASPVDSRSLGDVLESRRSVRRHGARCLGIAELGELLYRSARVRAVARVDESDGLSYDATRRPYPGGGACYALEVYMVAHNCDGVAPGIHHYEPEAHALSHVAPPGVLVDALIDDAQRAAMMKEPPQALLIVTSRFRRLSWKYSGIAYATGLKDLGALFQTLYLVATAMDLAVCALGSGDSALFARAAGTDWAAESSIGELVVGTRPDRV